MVMRADYTLKDKRFAPTIPGEFVFDALEAFRHQGRDCDKLLNEVGFDVQQLSLPGSRVSVVDYAALVERIIVELDDGFVGFLDARIPVKAFSVFASQLAACENIEQLFQQMNRFYALFTRQFHVELVREASITRIVIHYEETQDLDYRFIYQSLLVVFTRLIHWFVGAEVKFHLVQFTFEQSHLDKHFHYLFGCPLAYGGMHNEIHLDTELLSLPCSTTLDQVDAMLRDSRWMMLVSHKSTPFTREVRKALIVHREQGWLSIDDVSALMHMSKNLLWRKLKKENTSFLEIRDEVKRDLAMTLIGNLELQINEISEKLGFAEASSFNKAFAKWVGQSPSSYRAQLHHNG